MQNPSLGKQLTAKATPHTFDWTALQQQLPTIFSLHLFNTCAY